MKRLAIKIVIFLFLGAVVNVAVAWGCASWSDASMVRLTKRAAPSTDLERLQRAGWNPRQSMEHWEYVYWIHELRSFGVTEHYVVEEAKATGFRNAIGMFYAQFHIATISETGWPCRSLSSTQWDVTGNGQGFSISTAPWLQPNGGSLMGDPVDRRTETPIADWDRAMSVQLPPEIGFLSLPADRTLPLRPMWLGLAANTAIFALAAWLCAATLRGWRRLRRFSHGRCPACAYNLRGDYRATCSECGWLRKGADSV